MEPSSKASGKMTYGKKDQSDGVLMLISDQTNTKVRKIIKFDFIVKYSFY